MATRLVRLVYQALNLPMTLGLQGQVLPLSYKVIAR